MPTNSFDRSFVIDSEEGLKTFMRIDKEKIDKQPIVVIKDFYEDCNGNLKTDEKGLFKKEDVEEKTQQMKDGGEVVKQIRQQLMYPDNFDANNASQLITGINKQLKEAGKEEV